MRTPNLPIATALALLLASPVALAQDVGISNPETSTPTTLYFHVIDIQEMPINTQVPDDSWTDTPGYGGPATSTLTCVAEAGNLDNLLGTGTEYHRSRGYSSPSYVEYGFIQNGVPRTHPERGISYDAVFDQGAPFTLYWYVRTSSQLAGTEAVDNVFPAVIPNVVVEATMRAGDAISVDDISYDQGPVIAAGQTIPVALAAGTVQDMPTSPGGSAMVTYVGNPQVGHIYEFAVPMTLETDKVPRATGFNVRIDLYLENPACADPLESGSIMPNLATAYSGPDHRPRMEFAITNPIRLEYLHPQFVGDDLVVHTAMNSAWGNYDVHEETIQLAITGPSLTTSLYRAAIVQRTHEHYHHQEAVDVTYVWPYKDDRALNGVYTVEVRFTNDQGTAEALGIAQFEVGKGIVVGCGDIQESAQELNDDCRTQVQKTGPTEAKGSPGFELAGVVGVLAAALLAVRRRNP